MSVWLLWWMCSSERCRKRVRCPSPSPSPYIIAGTSAALSLRVRPTNALLALHDMIFTELPEEVHFHCRSAYWQPHLNLANVRFSRRWKDSGRASKGTPISCSAKWTAIELAPGVKYRVSILQSPNAMMGYSTE